jgi:hypothetical protein
MEKKSYRASPKHVHEKREEEMVATRVVVEGAWPSPAPRLYL